METAMAMNVFANERQADALQRRAVFIGRLRAAAEDLSVLAKDARNEHFGYDYASEASVKRAVRKALAAHGLAITDVNVTVMHGSTPTSAVVEVRLAVEDGGGERAWFAGCAGDQDKAGKAVMKAEAGAFKYALLQGFAIPTGDDPEANREADEMASEARKPKPARTKKPAPVGGDEW